VALYETQPVRHNPLEHGRRSGPTILTSSGPISSGAGQFVIPLDFDDGEKRDRSLRTPVLSRRSRIATFQNPRSNRRPSGPSLDWKAEWATTVRGPPHKKGIPVPDPVLTTNTRSLVTILADLVTSDKRSTP